MKFLNLGCQQKLYKTCKYDIVNLNTGPIPISNRKYKGKTTRKKVKKRKKKNTACTNINSREELEIE